MIKNHDDFSRKDESCNKKEFTIFVNLLPNFIYQKALIFFRMSPEQKVNLIKFYKCFDDTVVGMCGDGANDCGALLSSDIGISLNEKEETEKVTITSHFSYQKESISCIYTILRLGRACMENIMLSLKIIFVISIIQTTTRICLWTIDQDFTESQYIYQDLFLTLCMCLISSK